jgi:outer membrane protein insertion porin family
MSKRFLLLLSALCFSIADQHVLQADSITVSTAYDKMIIGNIEISAEHLPPNSSFDTKNILNRLKTKKGDPFSQAAFDEDLKTLSEDYDRVEPVLEVQNNNLYIILKVWIRPSIASIKWEGNSHVPTKKLQKELNVKEGSTFNRQTFNKAFNKVKEYYAKKGYFEAELEYRVYQDPKTNEVNITVEISEGRSGKIEDITFEGFTKTEKSQILEMIYTKKYRFLISLVTGAGIYKEEALEQDQMTIINLLQNNGYADAKVKISIRESQNAGKIIIDISAERGEVYHFGKITFHGNHIFDDKEIERQFLCLPGSVYSPEKLRLTTQNIKDLLGRKGYIEANVQYETQLVPNKPVYNIEFLINEGDQYKIGLVHVIGNGTTQSHVILRESLLVPGETFDSAKLKATQRRLEGIGYFKNVNVYAVRTQDDVLLGENYRDVYIEVEETTTGNISLFFGFSSADDLFGGLDLTETNFNFKGIPYIFKDGLSAVRGGGEYVHSKVSVGAKQRSYLFSWMTPYFRDTLWRVGFDVNAVQKSTLLSTDYKIDTVGGSIFASYPINSLWTFGTKYRIKNNLTKVASSVPDTEQEDASSSGLVSAIGASATFDSTDSGFKPHKGFRSFLEAEFSGVGADFFFWRFGYINSYYTPLWSRGIMKYRFDFRFIDPFARTHDVNKVPMSERFFLGGENSVRGYKAFDLGPHFSKTGDPTGGISSALLSVEYLQEVFKFLDLFVFTDAGSISMDRFQIGTFRLSYGVGARIEMLNRVPIILGWGVPVNPSTDSEVKHFFFSMGGQF